MRVSARLDGSAYNDGGLEALQVDVTSDSLTVLRRGVVMETFSNLSVYPFLALEDPEDDEAVDPQFWGAVNSNWITLEWLSPRTLRPEDHPGALEAPLPPTQSYRLYGGEDFRTRVLRIPSLTHIHERLTR